MAWHDKIKKGCKYKGITFRSEFERDQFRRVHLKFGDIVKYEPNEAYVPYVKKAWYLGDIVYMKKNGQKMIVELKGWFKAADRTKMLAVKKQNPEIDLRLVFQSDGWVTKAHATRYTAWAKRYGFTCAVGKIPLAWFEE